MAYQVVCEETWKKTDREIIQRSDVTSFQISKKNQRYLIFDLKLTSVGLDI